MSLNQKLSKLRADGHITDNEYQMLKQKTGYNCNYLYIDCDQFVCSECGIELQDWNGIERNNDGDIDYYEYVFKYCPNCGAKMVESEAEE